MKKETTQTKELFTSGEWKAEKHIAGRYYGNIISSLGRNERGIMNIRTIDIILKNNGEEEAEANARLIAESKNMYEALKSIENFLHQIVFHELMDKYENPYKEAKQFQKKAKAIITRINNKP